MAIKSYPEGNKTLYEVYVCRRSKNPRIPKSQRRRSGIESRARAERLERELHLECAEEIKTKEGKGDRWSDIVQKFKIYSEEYGNIQQDTVDDYVAMLKIWTPNFWDKSIIDISRADVRESIEHAKAKGKSNSHIVKLLHTIGRVFQWAKLEGLCPNHLPSITAGISAPKKQDKVPKILSWEQLQYFLEKAQQLNNPWYDIWATAIHTGMRSGELYSLKWANVDLEARRIIVAESFNKRKNLYKSTKNGQFRNVPINDYLFRILVSLKNRSESEFVLPRIKAWTIGHQAKAVQAFCSELGLPFIDFHALRACFATHLLSQGVPLGRVMKICGWAELKTVQRYLRLAGIDEKGATDCLNRLDSEDDTENLLRLEGGI